MPEQTSRRIVVASRPEGPPSLDNFRLETVPAPIAGPGEAVIRNLWLSVDPYMRGRLSAQKSYAKPVELGEVMIGGTVGQVAASNSHLVRVGDFVHVMGGWQDYCVLGNSALRHAHKLDRRLPLSVALGAAGMPGATALFGLTKIGKPKEGDTLVVSAGAGAVGSVVGQLAKQAGCRVVSIAGGPEKSQLCENAFRSDICIDYKNTEDLGKALADACPDGIDIYFENVGGETMDAVMPLLNEGARVPICGYVSQYNETNPITPWEQLSSLKTSVEARFFVVTEWAGEMPGAFDHLAKLIRARELNYRENVVRGLENAPQALMDVLSGQHLGKQVVRIANPQ